LPLKITITTSGRSDKPSLLACTSISGTPSLISSGGSSIAEIAFLTSLRRSSVSPTSRTLSAA
jgi:hypothetical protein